MSQLAIHPVDGPLRGRARVPGDKSISHRALLLGALAEGESHLRNWLLAEDCQATLRCLRALGVEIDAHGDADAGELVIHGRGLDGLRPPAEPLDCGRSGTTMRLLAGLLAGQRFDSLLTGDPQLLRRPMRRVVEPLRRMGAEITDQDGHGPLAIRGRPLTGCDQTLPVASAQVKSALLLAGLYAEGATAVRLPGPARDHTERMLQAQMAGRGWELAFNARCCHLRPAETRQLAPLELTVPGDLSSAAFLLAPGALVPNSQITIQAVGVNPTRTGLLDVMRSMGADVAQSNLREEGNEPVADLTVRFAPLRAAEVEGEIVVRMIDEFPILAVLATQAQGTTVVRGAAELRVKETDRIATMAAELGKMGAAIEPRPDGFAVHGPRPLSAAAVRSHGDHRVGMALAIAGLIAQGTTVVQEADCIADSFPGFAATLEALR